MIQSLTSPTDGPIGDSSLWLSDGTHTVLNQNDARPSELDAFKELGPVDGYLVQFSGAIWFPMVYELPARAKQAMGLTKRERQFDRTLRYIDELGARFVFPTAGPPCFLDEELWGFNDIFGDESNIFPDQTVYLDWLQAKGHDEGRLLLPGSVAALDEAGCPVAAPLRPGDDLRVRRDQDRVPARHAGAAAAGDRRAAGDLGAPRDRHPGRAAGMVRTVAAGGRAHRRRASTAASGSRSRTPSAATSTS